MKLLFRDEGQLDVAIQGVKTSFVNYPFDLVSDLIDEEQLLPKTITIKLASPQEIALMKAYAIGRRASFRDYIDIFYLLKGGYISIEGIIEGGKRKYVLAGESVFSEKLFFQQLSYTEDINDKKEAEGFILDENVTAETVESYLNAAVKSYLMEKYE